MVMPILTAIIPIREMAGRLQNLFTTIESSRGLPIRLILVIDSSTDGTLEEIQRFLLEEDHERTQIVVGNFGSAGFARNAGLKSIRTEFVTFWDSDDIPSPQICVDTLESLQNAKVDFIIGAFDEINLKDAVTKVNKQSASYSSLIRFAHKPGIWRIIFKSSLISEIKFSSLVMGEDQEFLARCFVISQAFTFSNRRFYCYITGHKDQATSSPIKLKMNFQLFDSTTQIIRETSYKIPKVVFFMYFFQFISMIRRSKQKDFSKRLPIFIATVFKVLSYRLLRA